MIHAFDFESYDIRPGIPFPPAVCMSYATITPDGDEGYDISDATVVLGRDGVDYLREALKAQHCFAGANTAFDVMVSVFSDPHPEELMGMWVGAYEDDRVTDVLLRQILLDLSVDEFRHRYSLETVSKELGTQTLVDKGYEGRRKYGDLDGTPLAQWPRKAIEYSEEDAVCTAECWALQEQRNADGSPYFPGANALLDQYRQARGALALADISGCGIRTDARDVARFKALTQVKHRWLRQRLVRAGLVTHKFKKDYEAIRRLVPSLPVGADKVNKKGVLVPGKPSLARKWLKAAATPEATLLMQWPASAATCVEAGLAVEKFTKKTKLAVAYVEQCYTRRGLEPLVKEIRDPYTKQIVRTTIRTDADACEQSGSRLLKVYSQFSALNKMLTTDMPLLEKSSVLPWHVHYRVLQSTGRTSSGAESEGDEDGNGQNTPRKPGVRECYRPRDKRELGTSVEGHVFFDGDFSALELWTFGQFCYQKVGYSQLGDDLKNGIDPHLRAASALLGITYEAALAAKSSPKVKKNRTAGKGVNFGRKGGMGAKKLVMYCWNNYKVKLGATDDSPNPSAAEQLAFAKEMIAIHDRLTPEFPDYSEEVQSYAREPGNRDTKYDLIHPHSGRLRAGLGFSDVHNYPFQGLASDLAKLALWFVFKARWGLSELGRLDPLYQALIVMFTHDSITGEGPRSKAPAQAKRLAELMYRASCETCPDCPSPVEPATMTRMSKNAEPRFDAAGVLTPWDPWEHCQAAAEVLCGYETVVRAAYGEPRYDSPKPNGRKFVCWGPWKNTRLRVLGLTLKQLRAKLQDDHPPFVLDDVLEGAIEC